MRNSAPLDGCRPGGAWVAAQLSRIMQRPYAITAEMQVTPLPVPPLAVIDEDVCIGCAKCLDACPVDAIVGAPHQLHGVLAQVCTGCGLCVPPCPVDCITLETAASPVPTAALLAEALANDEVAPCTACGACIPVCPVALDPQHLYASVAQLDFAATTAAGLAQCTECAQCTSVCPSNIPLAKHFAHAKALTAHAADAREFAARAAFNRDKHLARAKRATHDRASSVTLAALDAIDEPSARATIAAALARAKSSAHRI